MVDTAVDDVRLVGAGRLRRVSPDGVESRCNEGCSSLDLGLRESVYCFAEDAERGPKLAKWLVAGRLRAHRW